MYIENRKHHFLSCLFVIKISQTVLSRRLIRHYYYISRRITLQFESVCTTLIYHDDIPSAKQPTDSCGYVFASKVFSQYHDALSFQARLQKSALYYQYIQHLLHFRSTRSLLSAVRRSRKTFIRNIFQKQNTLMS